MFVIQLTNIDQISFSQYLRFKRDKQKRNFHYEAMPDDVTDSETCKFHKNSKIQISRYHKNEQNKTNKKIHELHFMDCFIAKNSFVAELTFNTRNRELNLEITLGALCPVSLFNIFSCYLHFDAQIIDVLIRDSLRFA